MSSIDNINRCARVRRNMRARGSTLAIAGACALAASAMPPAALAAAPAQAASQCQTVSASLLKANRSAEKLTKRLMRSTRYTPVRRTFTPKPTSTKGFTGYETIVVKSPAGTSPVAGYFTLKGTQRCSLVVSSAQVVLSRNAYVVKLAFPGEQGNPGRITITLVSR